MRQGVASLMIGLKTVALLTLNLKVLSIHERDQNGRVWRECSRNWTAACVLLAGRRGFKGLRLGCCHVYA